MKRNGKSSWIDVAHELSKITGKQECPKRVKYEGEYLILPKLKEALVADPVLRDWLMENGYVPTDI
tara:strand:- start:10587 stop:10784 length:198 start_codon:yes stop_codon:yes gene_type:complete